MPSRVSLRGRLEEIKKKCKLQQKISYLLVISLQSVRWAKLHGSMDNGAKYGWYTVLVLRSCFVSMKLLDNFVYSKW